MSARGLLLPLLLFAGCSAPPTRDDVLQTAIQAGHLACQTALNDPQTKWDTGAREYCETVVYGCRVDAP